MRTCTGPRVQYRVNICFRIIRQCVTVPTSFVLQFSQDKIIALADRYSYPPETRIVEEISPAVRERG
jgi:hypothetical protein